MSNYLITVNKEELQCSTSDVDSLDSILVNENTLHVLDKNSAFDVEIIHSNFLNKTVTLSINRNIYDVKLEDEYDQQIKKMGLLAVTTQKLNEVKAPMPGLIVDVLVEVGQEVIEGTPLLVLSAMKMENVILAQGEGVIKSVEVKKDDAVEKGQLIIEME
ncbi:MAG TPA: acetyl-CoA carboxylase biotin carboxyl carrier protein subunit [Maribacter sp.]|uniref:acetyl-CoA carboxylase biotin carboxyl carrier protein subunit n=1 Tax=unclassified Maribacter TaxID=2615042 RepID=UPI000EDDFD5F|nr:MULTISPECIES: acetyl-CoA carboxylase biotin carboxyl carrier protein subunit [unclassified Maribacter]HAF78712.1 acetyl-CoA carboxylase biotin carboxyl carrier protein subunit [Maribacter sp.]|tara:strand:- start:55 stop:534 length:480 start_codon:yes stop_codon:yes gene_type:complete